MAAPSPLEAPTPTTRTLPWLAKALFRRDRAGALVVEQLAQPIALRFRHRGVVKAGAGGHRPAALHGRALAHLLEPALEVLELLDVLALRSPAGRPPAPDRA